MPTGALPTDRVDYDHQSTPHLPPLMPPPSRLSHFPGRQQVEPVPPSNRPQALIPAAASERIASETLLALPGRKSRPPRLMFILRGLPGSGKSTLARLIKSKEAQAVAEESQEATVRVLSIDDFFMTEPDDSDVTTYVYEKEMETLYQKELVKLVCRQMDDGFFNFLIVDAVNQRVSEIEELAAQARVRNFQVYVIEVAANVSTCIRRSEGRRSKEDIMQIHANWEPTPSRFVLVDANSLQQEISSEEVEMDSDSENVEGESDEPLRSAQTAAEPKGLPAVDNEDEESLSEALSWGMMRSKWDREDNADRIERLDGLKRRLIHHSASSDLLSMSDYLKESERQFPARQPGIKRVTWADVEALRSKNRRRELGFVVGQSSSNLAADANDDLTASEALVQVKFF
uniref:YLP motif-containing protein 1 n=3 Tax=Schistocephalus solidus TaxID=70667 RepID=A0A0X3NZF3_SCHSO